MRDYAVEMRELIDKETDKGPYEPGAVASEIVTLLQNTDPDLLDGYLRGHAVHIIRDAINRRDQSQRMVARRGATSARMREILGAIDAGDVQEIAQVRQRWLTATFTLSDGMRHELRTMKRGDLLHVAEDYGRRAAENKMEETFFRALANKVQPGKTVGDMFDEHQIIALREGLNRFK